MALNKMSLLTLLSLSALSAFAYPAGRVLTSLITRVVIGAFGVTFDRGLDLGQQSENYISGLFQDIEKNASPLSITMKK